MLRGADGVGCGVLRGLKRLPLTLSDLGFEQCDQQQLFAPPPQQEAGLGLAPGAAFDPSAGAPASGWLRWCFASRDPQRLVQGVERLKSWLER